MKHVIPLLQNIAMIFGTALMTAVFSEMVFFNEGPAYDILARLEEPVELILWGLSLGFWYCFAVAPVLWAIWYFKARSIWALFLIGCLFGLTTEGLIIPAMYFELPFSLLWVVTSWHPIISFLLAWWGIRYVMQLNKPLYTALMAVFVGLLWGTWPTYLIGIEVDPEAVKQPIGDVYTALKPFEFFVFSAVGTLAWIIGNLLIDHVSQRQFVPSKFDTALIALASLFFFVVIVISVQILSLAFIFMAALLWLGLRHNRVIETRESIFARFEKIKLYHYVLMLLVPVVATLTYWAMTANDLKIEAFIYGTPLWVGGLIMLILSYYKLFTAKSPS